MTPLHAIRAITVLFLVLPCVPISISWRRLAKPSVGHARATHLERAILILVSLSQAFLMLGLLSTAVIGHDYSPRRYATIEINFVAMLGATVIAAVAGRRARLPLTISGAWVTCSWAYLGMISSVV